MKDEQHLKRKILSFHLTRWIFHYYLFEICICSLCSQENDDDDEMLLKEEIERTCVCISFNTPTTTLRSISTKDEKKHWKPYWMNHNISIHNFQQYRERESSILLLAFLFSCWSRRVMWDDSKDSCQDITFFLSY